MEFFVSTSFPELLNEGSGMLTTYCLFCLEDLRRVFWGEEGRLNRFFFASLFVGWDIT